MEYEYLYFMFLIHLSFPPLVNNVSLAACQCISEAQKQSSDEKIVEMHKSKRIRVNIVL